MLFEVLWFKSLQKNKSIPYPIQGIFSFLGNKYTKRDITNYQMIVVIKTIT